jgi:hypothetical protein
MLSDMFHSNVLYWVYPMAWVVPAFCILILPYPNGADIMPLIALSCLCILTLCNSIPNRQYGHCSVLLEGP